MRARVPASFIVSLIVSLILLTPLCAQQKYNNLRILKIPEDQVVDYMLTINEALGVECTFCHDPHSFAADDYKPKETARMMIGMTQEINAKFPTKSKDGPARVTCYTCHRGAKAPLKEPAAAK